MGVRDDQKAATRAKVMDTARELFIANGYDGVSIRDVATKADVSTGSIFSSFSGKDALFEEVMGEAVPKIEDFLAYVGEGKFDADRGNDGAEAKLAEMAERAASFRRLLYGTTA